MTNDEACKWLENLRQDIGNPHYECLWVYEQAICEIMSMLEEQDPRVLAQDDIEHTEVVWYEARRGLYIRPMLTRGKTFGENSVPWFQYGRDWRCWSSRPTDEQRKAVKWDE